VANAPFRNRALRDQKWDVNHAGTRDGTPSFVDTLLESQLFGHMRDAFTGATETRPGLFGFANGGTVFLDEIGETSLTMQAKLLRMIQNREIQRVGSPEVRQVNVRLIAVTNRDLRTEVLAGRFREGLFYRLSSIQIRIPCSLNAWRTSLSWCSSFGRSTTKHMNMDGLSRSTTR